MALENLAVGCLLVFTGAGIVLICTPLLLGWIKPNAFYGIRLGAAFRSGQKWYQLNAYGAQQLILWAAVMMLPASVSASMTTRPGPTSGRMRRQDRGCGRVSSSITARAIFANNYE